VLVASHFSPSPSSSSSYIVSRLREFSAAVGTGGCLYSDVEREEEDSSAERVEFLNTYIIRDGICSWV
jgi:hypothetical protein